MRASANTPGTVKHSGPRLRLCWGLCALVCFGCAISLESYRRFSSNAHLFSRKKIKRNTAVLPPSPPPPPPPYKGPMELYFLAYKDWILKEYARRGNGSQPPQDVVRAAVSSLRQRKPDATVGVVIAHYKEDLRWVDEWFPNDIPGLNVYVYSKGGGGAPMISCKRPVKRAPLPNVGMCDHTYLTHILAYYGPSNSSSASSDRNGEGGEGGDSDGNLALDDQTVFLTDSVPLLLYKRAQLDMIIRSIPDNDGVVPWKPYSKAAAREMDGLRVEEYCQAGVKNARSSQCKTKRSSFGNYSEFRLHMLSLEQDRRTIGQSRGMVYWGVFGVSRKAILSRSRQMYENLLESLSDSIHPENAHFMERLWVDVFHGNLLK